MLHRGWLLALALVGPAPAAPAAPSDATPWVLTREATDVLRTAAAPYELTGAVTDGWTWSGLSIDRGTATFRLQGPDSVATITLRHPDEAAPDGAQLSLEIDASSDDGRQAAQAFVDALRATERAGELDALWSAADRTPPPETRAPPPELERYGPWFIPMWIALALALLVTSLRALLVTSPRPSTPAPDEPGPRRRALVLLLLTGAALALRLALATWGPGDHHMNLAAALPGHDPGLDHEYGAAPSGLLALVLAVAPVSVATLVGVNLVLGSLAPTLACALARALGLSWRLAVFTGVVIASHPVLVRHAGEANRQPYVTLTALVALWALARHATSETRARVGWLGLAALAATLCLWSRPEAALLLALLPIPVLSCGPGSLRDSLVGLTRLRVDARVQALAVIAALAVTWLVTRLPQVPATAIAGTVPRTLELHKQLLWLDPGMTPIVLPALAVLGFVAGARARERLLLWMLPAVLVMSHVVSAYPTWGDQLCNARYHTLSLIPIALAAARGLAAVDALVPGAGPRPRALTTALAVLALAVATIAPMRRVTAPRTEDRELAFLLEAAAALPDGATVVVVNYHDDAVIKAYRFVPLALGRAQDRGQTWTTWHEFHGRGRHDERGPVFYYHAASCASARIREEARRECEEGLRRHAARPFRVRALGDSLHSLAAERRPVPVEVGLYHLEDATRRGSLR